MRPVVWGPCKPNATWTARLRPQPTRRARSFMEGVLELRALVLILVKVGLGPLSVSTHLAEYVRVNKLQPKWLRSICAVYHARYNNNDPFVRPRTRRFTHEHIIATDDEKIHARAHRCHRRRED